MRVVLYTQDFEPITVLELPMWALEMAAKQGTVRVPILKKIQAYSRDPISLETDLIHVYIVIHSEWLVWKNGERKQILITNQDEQALLLTPAWLSGQQAAINEFKRDISGLAGLLGAVLGR